MTWKGTLRSIAAAQRRSEREALRKQRELERERKQYEVTEFPGPDPDWTRAEKDAEEAAAGETVVIE